MGNIIDYVKTEMRTFAQKPFCAVDSLVLSQISYLDMEDLVPSLYDDEPSVPVGSIFRAECFDQLVGKTYIPENNLSLLTALVASPRFRNMKLNYFVNEVDAEVQMQFSAVTFFTDEESVYIAFRGTDSTMVGWKEDLNMAFTYPLPAQEAGLIYVDAVSGFLPKSIDVRIGGHSKGGNIAVYSAMKCHLPFRKQILEIYNHDGPGFTKEVLESEEFLSVSDRIRKSMPQSSVFGILLHQQENYSVIESSGVGGFLQHIPFNWCIEDGDFCYVDKLANGSKHTHATVNEWLSNLSQEDRRHFIDTLYKLIEATEAKTLKDLTGDWLKGVGKFLAAAKELDPETKKFVQSTFSELVKLSFKNLNPVRQAKSTPVLIPEKDDGSSD
ncbi:MAG: DUF2974 domain-containing protein [Clostridiales bacterium]|nr:DUF2974 domain-containing protein [Clostridiales bacterium]